MLAFMVDGALEGALPLHYVAYFVILTVIPFMSMVLVSLYFRHDVVSALKLFYAVELPLMLLLLLRVILFRDAPLPTELMCLFFLSGITIYGYRLLAKPQPKSPIGRFFDLLLSGLVASVGLYLGALLGLYFFPIIVQVIVGFIEQLLNLTWASLLDIIDLLFISVFAILLAVLFFMSATFFLAAPFVLITVYVQQFITCCREKPLNQSLAVICLLLLCGSLLLTFQRDQAQLGAFELTASLPTVTDEQRKTLLDEQDFIRQGLVNAYLSPYRYISTTGSSQSLSQHYEDAFGEKASIAPLAQQAFNTLAAPFLYQGEGFDTDRQLAAAHYQQLFDTPIEKAESESIQKAIKATWQREQNAAGLINAESRTVLLTQQNVTVQEQGNFATITIQQLLENQTFDVQEVLYHFSLPEDVAITGLWLSDDTTQPEKFTHVISPRGAAQSVYTAEVSRRVDPALLEQVGPLQYRLRAFPIPPRNQLDTTAKQAVVQFQYIVSKTDNGTWPLPTLLEKRNVYWNNTTQHHYSLPVHGQFSKETASNTAEELITWLPKQLTASSKANTAQIHQALIDGQVIQAHPRTSQASPSGLPPSKVAVVIDGSYSMHKVREQLEQQIQYLLTNNITADLFFCQSQCKTLSPAQLNQATYFGDSQLLQQLLAWSQQYAANKEYDALFFISDAGSYELSDEDTINTSALSKLPQALWLIHLDQLPYAYADAIIELINRPQSGIALSTEDAIARLQWQHQAATQALDQAQQLLGLSEHFFWYRLPESVADQTQSSTPFTALAAKRWIQHLAATEDSSQLKVLDRVHALAKELDILSFYSSMLVLVEDRQRELLKAAELQDDRFKREVETGKEEVGSPSDAFAVPAVPEPEEWALLIIACSALLWVYWRKRRTEGVKGIKMRLAPL